MTLPARTSPTICWPRDDPAKGEAMDEGAPIGDLADWEQVGARRVAREFDYPVYQRGEGPRVILLHEFFGIRPDVVGLGDQLVENGFAVTMPYLFGQADDRSPRVTPITQARLCITKEFWALGGRGERGFSAKLRALAEALHAQNSSRPGVGVIGMCFTGGFALAAAVSPSVVAPVLGQPALPGALFGGAMPLGRDEMSAVSRRARDEGLCVLGVRFSGDRISPKRRFSALQKRLGDAFEVIELDSSWGNPGRFGPMAHSVLTGEVREEPPNDAAGARDRVVTFLKEQLT